MEKKYTSVGNVHLHTIHDYTRFPGNIEFKAVDHTASLRARQQKYWTRN